MRYQVLGPIRASTDRGFVELGGPKQRLVLALLLADANRAVAEDRLIDGVWGEDPPGGARHALQTYISELRRLLDDEIRREGKGYRLVVEPDAVDLHRFDALVEAARARLSDAPGGAAKLLREALALWHGEPYADITDALGLLPEIARLQQARLSAVEDRVRADLDSGRHADLVGELEALTREHPFRERLTELHMLALYRAGRQADALRVYDRTRELLAEELGIDPSPELRSLHRRILEQDSELLPSRELESSALEDRPGDHERAGDLQVIRGFELRERVGGGDFGTVYRAYQASVGREVAIKILRPEYSNAPDFVRGFDARARRVAEMNHRNVLPLLDSWRDPSGAYLVSPWVPGGSVRRALRHGPWSLVATLRMLEEVGGALGSAHRHGVVHGDVKASNVLLDDEGNALLTDFAVASRTVDAAGTPQTSTPASISPEERGGRHLAPASDVYALAVLAVEVLTAAHPSLEQPTAGLGAARPDLPPALQTVLARAMEPDPERRYGRVEDLLRELRRATGVDVVAMERLDDEATSVVRNPYKGLRAFREADATDFFGREALIDRLVETVGAHRLAAVVGPSGSGKSSLVRAGLIPALRAGALPRSRDWLITEMFPGSYPFEEMEAALLRIATHRPEGLLTELMADDRGMLRATKQILPDDDSELVLVLDQFEELFSLTADQELRQLFLDGLVTMAGDGRGRVRTVLTLRADFFDRPLEHHAFGELVRAGLVAVTVPSPEELARAVSRPAERVGIEYEPGLVGEIVGEVAGQPGGLPLLQHALTELFTRRDGRRLTRAAYRASGGVLGALGRRAEELYRSLPAASQDVAQQVLLRLVSVDEQAEDSRRRVGRSELTALGDPKAVDQVIRQFGAHRLLSFDHDPVTRGPTVEVAHEALFREWSSLRGWIDTRRDDLLLRRRLAAAVSEWREAGRPEDYLPGGGRLDEFEHWAGATELALTAEEREFLSASRAREDRRTLRRKRRRLGIVAGSVAATVVALTLSTFALIQRNEATRERRAAQRQATVADARRLATQALAENRLDRSLLLALAAVRLDDSVESRRALLGSLVRSPEAIGVMRGPGEFLQSIAVSPDGRTIAVGSSTGQVAFFDADTRRRMGEPIAVEGEIERTPGSLAFAPDGRVLAVAAQGRGEAASNLELLDVAGRTTERRIELPPGVGPEAVAFSWDGRTLAAATHEFPEGVSPFGPPPRKAVLLFDAASGALVDEIPLSRRDLQGPTLGLAFSPDNAQLVTSTDRGTTVVWEISVGEPTRTFDGGGPMGMSNDGTRVAIGREDGSVTLLDLQTGRPRELVGGHSSPITSVAFGSDGASVVSTSDDGTAGVWDLMSERAPWAPPGGPDMALRGHARGVSDAAFAPDGRTLYTAGDDGLVIEWDLGGHRRLGRRIDRGVGTPEYSQIFALSPRGDLLAVPRADGTIVLTDLSTTEAIVELHPVEEGPVYGLAFSPDGRTIASTGDSSIVHLWDVETGSAIGELRLRPRPEGGGWWTTFSPDGTMLATTFSPDPAALRTTAIVWDVESRRRLMQIDLEGGAAEIDFSPDGRYVSVVTCCGDGVSEAGVWEVGTWRRVLSPAIEALVPQTDFSPDGRTLVVGDLDGNITFWDIPTGEQEGPGLSGLQGVNSVGLSPDGSVLAAADTTGEVLLWWLPSGERIGTLPGTDFPAGVAFTPDGRHLAVTHITGSAFIWDLDVESWKRHTCSVAGRNLATEEWEQLLPGRPYVRLCPWT